ncbi:MAG: hypothetical protein KDE31_19750 [Caldilineaceae bacterium]|nr:hypothetical protein [Caldilineaceae bacterium]
MYAWIFFTVGSVFLLSTTIFALLFRVLAGRVQTDVADGCLGLYLSMIGAGVALSCFYFAVTL